MLLNRAQFGVLQDKSIIVQDFSGFDRNHIPLPKRNVTPQALKHIISLFANSSNEEQNEEQVEAAVNKMMTPDNLIPLAQAANFLGIAALKKIVLSDNTLTKIGDYVTGHPHELDRLTVLADDTAFGPVFKRLRDMFATRHILTVHGSAVRSVALSRHDGTSFASGSRDGSICIWNTKSGKLLLTLNGHTDWVNTVAWSPDGTSLASGSNDKSIRIWNAESGKLLRTLNGHTDRVTSLALSPDGTSLASRSDDKSIRIWNAESGKLLHTLKNGHTDRVTSVAWSRDGTSLVSGSYGKSIRIWNNVAFLTYDNTKLSAAEVVIAWFILTTSDPNKITSDILELVPQDLLSTLVDTAGPNIAQKIQSLGFPLMEGTDEIN